jgi:hypothetical protein
MKTSEKSSKKDYPLRTLAKEMETDFKKRCDECTAKRKETDEFRESKHAEEYEKLNAENKRLQDYFDQKTDEYHKNNSSNFRETKYFKRYWIIITCLTLAIGGIITQSAFHFQHYRKMIIYNSTLKYLQDVNPNTNYGQLIRTIKDSGADPDWHKSIKEQIKDYDDLWWKKE